MAKNKKSLKVKYVAHADDRGKPERCLVCFGSNGVKSYGKDKILKVPAKVISQLKTKLSNDILKSLEHPCPSYKNYLCELCFQLQNDLFSLCCKLETVLAQIDLSVNQYVQRIQCREISEESLPLITVSKDCFENEIDNCDEGLSQDFHEDHYDSVDDNEVDLKFPITLINSKSNIKCAPEINPTKPLRRIPRQRRKAGAVQELVVALKRFGPSKLKCKTCLKYFSSTSALEFHKRIHIQLMALKCPTCKNSLQEKTSLNIKLTAAQCYMNCARCRKSYVFEKKIHNRQRKFVNSAFLDENHIDQVPNNAVISNTKTYDGKKRPLDPLQRVNCVVCYMSMTLSKIDFHMNQCHPMESNIANDAQSKSVSSSVVKDKTDQKSCKICEIPVLHSMFKAHMNHYHPNENVEDSDSEVEIVAVKIQEKLITKKPPRPEPVKPKEPEKTGMRCMTCKNHLVRHVPAADNEEVKTMTEKFPGRPSLYCTRCKMVFVVGGKNKVEEKKKPSVKKKNDFKVLPEQNTYKCEYCTGSFATQYMLCHHKQWRCRSITRFCHVCDHLKDKSFRSAIELRNHVETEHSGMDKALWNICSKCCDSYKDKITHEEFCTGTMGKLCSQCETACSSDGSLLRHIRSSHPSLKIKLGTKPPKSKRLCESCGKQYFDFKKHSSICGKLLRKSKKYECTKCKDKDGDSIYFENKRKLKVHVRLYHILVHKCDQCDKGFSKPMTLKSHLRVKHSVPVKTAKDKL